MASRSPSTAVATKPRRVRTTRAERSQWTPEQWQADYLTKSSAAPDPTKCGSRLPKRHLATLRNRTPWRYCTQDRMRGRPKCRIHGGPSLTGMAHPRYRNGKRTNPFAAGSALAEGYTFLRTDEQYLSVKEQMRLLTAREEMVVERIRVGEGESAAAWARAREAMGQIEAAMAVRPPTEASAAQLQAGIAEIRAVVVDGAEREEAFRELREIGLVFAKLSETEAKLQERHGAVLSAEEYLSLANAVGELANRCIRERAMFRQFITGLRALMGQQSPPMLPAPGPSTA